MMKTNNLTSLVGLSPNAVLPHGPSKVYLDAFLWHDPKVGVVAIYTAREKDTLDHFGVFRGADQIEAFGQASVVAGNAFISCVKKEIGFSELYEKYNFVFMSMGQAICKSFIKLGDTAIMHAHFDDYKFRQMTSSGKIYKAPKEFDLETYYKTYSAAKFKKEEVPTSYIEVSEFKDLKGRGIKNSLI
ncbi:hypothetical protein [Zobellia amurskyensis]|nr:hypothetical protein [Zobellia amurskyensis]